MSTLQTIKVFLLLGFLPIFWGVGCSNTHSPPDIVSTSDKEFNFNYALLHYYYYKADKELREPEAYINNPNANLLPAKYANVADIIFMYYDMTDPMTTYYPHEMFNTVNESISQSTTEPKSFGMELSSILSVQTVYRKGPAASAGISRGDTILSLNGISLQGNDSLYNALLSSQSEDTFLFTVKRQNDTLEISMTRENVLAPTVYLDSADGVPWIRITKFTETTNGFSKEGSAKEFEDALNKTTGAKSIILDLRGNTGGTVDLCERMSAELLSQGDTVIIEKKWGMQKNQRATEESIFTASRDGIGKGRYYVLMLDNQSASCTEIFAAAITANLKTPIVGTTSFGKGIGQIYVTTPDTAFGAVTNTLFYDKDGKTYHTYGFEPDFSIPDADSALTKAVELAKEGTFKRTAGYSTQIQPFWGEVKKKAVEKPSPATLLQNLKTGMALRILDHSLFDFDH